MTNEVQELKELSLRMRRRIVELAHKAGRHGAHLGGSLSIVEIFAALYARARTTLPGAERDRVILSKGHAALAHYALLEARGVLSREETDTFKTDGTHFYAHESRNPDHGIEFSGGSLSLGISFAVGTALACRRRGLSNRIYAIVGDGECNEGLVWESLTAISAYGLDNMTVIVDCNGVQLDGPTAEVMDMGSLAEKLRAFGFDVAEVDGHDVEALLAAFDAAGSGGRPRAIVARTVKGKGLSFCEGLAAWHQNVLTDKLYEQALEELK